MSQTTDPGKSLFDELKQSRGALRRDPQPSEKRVSKLDPLQGKQGIMQHTTIMKLLEEVLNEECLPAKARASMVNHRTRLGDNSWKLSQVLGKVNDTLWRGIVRAQLGGFQRTIEHQQPNGKWQLAEWAADIHPDVDKVERIWLVCKFVDANNNTDLQYRNGVPIHDTNVNVQLQGAPAMDRELIEALKSNSGGNQLLEEMLKVMQANARIQAAQAGVDVSDLLPADAAGSAPDKSSKGRGKKVPAKPELSNTEPAPGEGEED